MKLTIDIQANTGDGRALLSECSRVFHASLRVGIERLMHRSAGVTALDVSIGRMVIDLGELDAARWQTVLHERLLSSLFHELASLPAYFQASHNKRSAAAEDARRPMKRALRSHAGVQVAMHEVVVRAPSARHRAKTNREVDQAVIKNTKSKQETAIATHKRTKASTAIAGGGLVLLWPLLPRLFDDLGCTEVDTFIGDINRYRAVDCLDWLIASEGTPLAHHHDRTLPTVSRVLCGLPLDAASKVASSTRKNETGRAVDTHTRDIFACLNAWRESLPSRLPGTHRCAWTDITTLFLQRPGTVCTQNGNVTIQVAPDASDILLRALPWPMGQVILPWLDAPITIDWL